jgi:hypothetical protein
LCSGGFQRQPEGSARRENRRALLALIRFRFARGIPIAFPSAGGSAMQEERRNIKVRAAVVQRVIDNIVQNPSVTLSVNTLQTWLDVPLDAAQRILQRLASSGLVREVQRGVWTRGTWPGAQREWY